jgi:hypothetical protein
MTRASAIAISEAAPRAANQVPSNKATQLAANRRRRYPVIKGAVSIPRQWDMKLARIIARVVTGTP